ncbi:sensor histidine kinase [Sciscionella marina]|uniref:sensor histidine kinase n=1 Tax=Sciscionella marina TaxID=508770 RepID=UPI000373C482|nr:ATP-binding protein [Sciscionella marina]
MRSRLSVRARTTAVATTVVAAALAAIGWLLIGYLHNRLSTELDSSVHLQLARSAAAVQYGRTLPVRTDAVDVQVVPGKPAAQLKRAGPARPARMSDTKVASTAVPTGEGVKTVVARASTEPVAQATSAATGALLIGGPILLALVGALTWFGTGRALRPVEAIRHEFARLSAHELSARMPVPSGRDEITKLAETLNETLERLDRSVRRQQRFIADASHELRSPLATMRTPLEVARAHPELVHWPDVADGALEDLDRLERLSADLLTLARIDSSPMRPEPVDLAAIAADAIGAQPESGLDWRFEAADEAVIEGHPRHLARLLANLLDNARAHAASTVRVRLRVRDHGVRLDVLDDGPGIPADQRERIFERFARLDTARNAEAGGTGLGLAIAREIAEAHGGTLRAEPPRAGSGLGGAHFTAAFPR